MSVERYFLIHVSGQLVRGHMFYVIFLLVDLNYTEAAMIWARLLVLSDRNWLDVG